MKRRHSQRTIGKHPSASLLFLLLAACRVFAGGFASGTGEPNDPYQIASAGQLASIGSNPDLLNKHFVLVADIDLDPNLPENGWVKGTIIPSFGGTFDGRGHRIMNMGTKVPPTPPGRGQSYAAGTDWTDGSSLDLSLFGTVEAAGVVRNLTLENVNLWGASFNGPLAKTNLGHVRSCHMSGTMTYPGVSGGLVWRNWGLIERCSADCVFVGKPYSSGALVGWNEGLVAQSHCNSNVPFAQTNLGALVFCTATGRIDLGMTEVASYG